jgi:putative membrane protein
VPKTIARKEILQAQYKIMTYRLWYIITFSAILQVFCVFDAVFTDLGKAWLQMPWMHVKLGFVFALYLYHGKCPNFQLQNDQIKYTTIYAFMERRIPSFFFCGSLLVILKMPLIDLRSYWNFYIRTYNHVRF